MIIALLTAQSDLNPRDSENISLPSSRLRNFEMSVLSSYLQEATLGLSLITMPTPVSPLRARSTNEAPELMTPTEDEGESGLTEVGRGTRGRSSPVMERSVARRAEWPNLLSMLNLAEKRDEWRKTHDQISLQIGSSPKQQKRRVSNFFIPINYIHA